jgi:hypothetical protein
MIHHAVRLVVCCCFECPADNGNRGRSRNRGYASSSGSSSHDTAFLLAKSTVPDVILRVTDPGVRDSIVLLYCFVKIEHRLPYSTEIWRRRRLGEWAARTRATEAKGPLIKEQREAFDAVPMWRPTTTQPMKLAVAAPQSSAAAAQSMPQAAARPSAPPEKQPLLGAPPAYEP